MTTIMMRMKAKACGPLYIKVMTEIEYRSIDDGTKDSEIDKDERQDYDEVINAPSDEGEWDISRLKVLPSSFYFPDQYG